jgi:alkyldihydroxyacetonephosphate synthase
MTKKNTFEPDWTETPPEQGSYRSIFKWGGPSEFKHPGRHWFEMMKEEFRMTDSDFINKKNEGRETVTARRSIKLGRAHIEKLRQICGRENVATDDYSRVRFSYGKTIEESIDLRAGKADEISDAAVHPRSKEEIRKIVNYCDQHGIPVYAYGGGSSVTLGLRPSMGGITLVMGTHMNRIIDINETNQTARVQPGLMGPAFEDALNNAPERYKTKLRYTCGHFPQSFEYSSVGGWAVTLGSGQASSYYGDAYTLVISQEFVTPSGSFVTRDYPATANGPKVNDIMKGSEGSFGILVELTMKIYRYMPENRRRFAFMFPSYESAVKASREIIQGEFGMPAVFRISDPEETEVGLKLFGIHDTIADKFMRLMGQKPMRRCLCIGTSEGEKGFTRNVKKNIRKICRRNGALYLTGYATKMWEKTRYREPYMREDLQDYGIIIDTLETSVTWDNLHNLHESVRKYIKNRPGTICMTHASHFYPQGTNLYFIYIARFKSSTEYKKFQTGVIDAIVKNGGSPSHHHGVGKMLAPWMETHLGTVQMNTLRSLKRHFDPNNIMNPGGQMGLDLPEVKNRTPRKGR